ncbi:uncharacterized protein [Blastocystis hominis]|uniref:Transmembrane protein 208 n=1 Tax=Blastocystis hominis TaxID=12968 RepID=D8LVT1_BLAHO|nr:uncharacterized protein [Blastocystis hominis]CBK19920.2 unnamed protein product [Blastocystis hominis]|eukprot:XP_012893968.1 uncharacterized protein [Blastocystis hominis]
MIMENCKTMVFTEAIEGYFGDMFIISCVISFFIAYSRKWMWVYIFIPIYFGYLGIRLLLNWVFTPDESPEKLEEMKSNRQKKREAKMAKQKAN